MKPLLLTMLLAWGLSTFLGSAAAIHDAAAAGDVAKLKELLEAEPTLIRATNDLGDTPLHAAIHAGHAAAAELLLARGADIHAENGKGVLPIHIAASDLSFGADFDSAVAKLSSAAARKGELNPAKVFAALFLPTNVLAGRLQVLDALLQRGAMDQFRKKTDWLAPQHLAAWNRDGRAMRALLKAGADHSTMDALRMRPIHWAVLFGNTQAVDVLIQAGANVNAAAQTGTTPLLIASRLGDVAGAEQLLKAGAFVEEPNNDGFQPLHAAVVATNLPVVSLLLDRKASVRGRHGDRVTVMHNAANSGSIPILDRLAAAGAELDAPDGAGFTPLLNAIERSNRIATDWFIARQADPLAKTRDGRSALHLAAAGNDLALMEKALAWGCPINAEQTNGLNVLNTAALMGHHTAVDFLLKKGASAQNEGSVGSPLHSAAVGYWLNLLIVEEHKTNASPSGLRPFFGTPADFTATVALLLSNGLPVNAVNARGSAPLHLAASAPVALVRVLLDAGAEIERRDKYNFTPLLRAAQGGSVQNVELLLDRGADMKAVNTRGFNALFWAAHLGQAEVVSLLLKRGFDAKARDVNQATPLHWAALYGSETAVRALLDGGAEIDARDLVGQTPLHQAVTARRLSMVRLLLSLGAATELGETVQGHRPVDAARRFGFYEIADAIEAHSKRIIGQ